MKGLAVTTAAAYYVSHSLTRDLAPDHGRRADHGVRPSQCVMA
jgi:hypothetical protein